MSKARVPQGSVSQSDLDPEQGRLGQERSAPPATCLSGEGFMAAICTHRNRGRAEHRARRSSSLDDRPEASKGFVKRQEVQDPLNEFTQPLEYQVFVFLRLERKGGRPAPSWQPSWFVPNLLGPLKSSRSSKAFGT